MMPILDDCNTNHIASALEDDSHVVLLERFTLSFHVVLSPDQLRGGLEMVRVQTLEFQAWKQSTLFYRISSTDSAQSFCDKTVVTLPLIP